METLIQAIRLARTPAEIVQLEQDMLQYLRDIDADKHHRTLGWSRGQPRWHATETANLRAVYRRSVRNSGRLKWVLEQACQKKEQACVHNWKYDAAERDDRTHYVCAKCGKSR